MDDGLRIGRVATVDGAFVTVTVAGRRYGPLEGLVGTALAVGDRVLLGTLHNQPEALAIVRQLPEV